MFKLYCYNLFLFIFRRFCLTRNWAVKLIFCLVERMELMGQRQLQAPLLSGTVIGKNQLSIWIEENATQTSPF